MKIPKRKPQTRGHYTDIHNNRVDFDVEEIICIPQHNNPKKEFVVQKLTYDKSGKVEYRVAYYIIGVKKKKRGKWIWAEACPIFPKEDLMSLIKEIKKAKKNRKI